MPKQELPAHVRLSLTPQGGKEMVVTALPAVLGGVAPKSGDTGPMWVAGLGIIEGRLMVWGLGGGEITVNGERHSNPVSVSDGDCVRVGEQTYVVGIMNRWKPEEMSNYDEQAVTRHFPVQTAD